MSECLHKSQTWVNAKGDVAHDPEFEPFGLKGLFLPPVQVYCFDCKQYLPIPLIRTDENK